MPWAYFDGASQGEPPLGGAGVANFLSTNRKVMTKFSMGQATNNKVELSALWITLKVARSYQI